MPKPNKTRGGRGPRGRNPDPMARSVTPFRWRAEDLEARARIASLLGLKSDVEVTRLGLHFLRASIERCEAPEAAIDMVRPQLDAVRATRRRKPLPQPGVSCDPGEAAA